KYIKKEMECSRRDSMKSQFAKVTLAITASKPSSFQKEQQLELIEMQEDDFLL
ncbi:hypothetical protein WUBG_15663, partial [Wuchereria bancrofti]